MSERSTCISPRGRYPRLFSVCSAFLVPVRPAGHFAQGVIPHKTTTTTTLLLSFLLIPTGRWSITFARSCNRGAVSNNNQVAEAEHFLLECCVCIILLGNFDMLRVSVTIFVVLLVAVHLPTASWDKQQSSFIICCAAATYLCCWWCCCTRYFPS